MEKDATESTKKGGPYTKTEQEKRRSKVYNLHFEKGYPAIKIAELLQINRNTINEDIHFLYGEIGKQIPERTSSLVLKQLDRLEIQHVRLSNQLENEEDFKKRMIIEKMLFAINDKLAQLIVKMTKPRWNFFV